jgi:hypothetical protein
MEVLNTLLLVILIAEVFLVLSNLSKLRVELTQRHEKLTSQPSETKK